MTCGHFCSFIRYICILAAVLTFHRTLDADIIHWLDVSTVPGQTNVVIDDPVLGMVQISANPPAQAAFSAPAGSLGENSWSSFDYINYDASTTGTNNPINGILTFTFLDGPINSAQTLIYFTSSGLAENSTYVIDNNPLYLGDIRSAEGTGTHTVLGNGLLEIEGAGFNHNPDLFRFDAVSISSISVQINQVLGDGAGFTIGAVAIPEPTFGFLFCCVGTAFLATQRRHKRFSRA